MIELITRRLSGRPSTKGKKLAFKQAKDGGAKKKDLLLAMQKANGGKLEGVTAGQEYIQQQVMAFMGVC